MKKLIVTITVLFSLVVAASPVMAQDGSLDLHYDCTEKDESIFIVENNSDTVVDAQDAYISVSGISQPVGAIPSGGSTTEPVAATEGTATLFLYGSEQSSVEFGNRSCDSTQYQYGNDSSTVQYSDPDKEDSSGISVLPDTGGASLYTLGAGALLVAAGLIFRRMAG